MIALRPRGSGGEIIIASDARGMDRRNFSGISRASRGTGVSAGVARADCIVGSDCTAPARSRERTVPGTRAGTPTEEKRKSFVPPPAGRAGRVPRESFRGKYRIPPAGFASRGRVVSPRRGTRRPPLGASGALPPRFARLRGRGLPQFCRLHHVGPLRPGTMNILHET